MGWDIVYEEDGGVNGLVSWINYGDWLDGMGNT